jgi:hypothetical protein
MGPGRDRVRALSALLLLLAFVSPVDAGAQVSLPLAGYYRPGRYMPVRVRADGLTERTLSLRAQGSMRTTIELAGGAAAGREL